MKKLLMGTAFLTVIGLAITASQFSCTKGSAQTSTTGLSQLNKIVYTASDTITTSYRVAIYVMDYNGSNNHKLNIDLTSIPAIASAPTIENVRLSPDGQTVFFDAYNGNNGNGGVYSASAIDGSNLKTLVSSTTAFRGFKLGGAY